MTKTPRILGKINMETGQVKMYSGFESRLRQLITFRLPQLGRFIWLLTQEAFGFILFGAGFSIIYATYFFCTIKINWWSVLAFLGIGSQVMLLWVLFNYIIKSI